MAVVFIFTAKAVLFTYLHVLKESNHQDRETWDQYYNTIFAIIELL